LVTCAQGERERERASESARSRERERKEHILIIDTQLLTDTLTKE
jgi:hypothetical protein